MRNSPRGAGMTDHVRLAEAARRLGVGRTTARNWFDEGLLRGHRLLGRRDRVVEAASVEELRVLLKMPDGPEQRAALEDLKRRNAEVNPPAE